MGGVARRVPLTIVCQRPGCGRLRIVRRPWQQRQGGYCSARCAALVTRNIARADHAQGGRTSGQRRRATIARQFVNLSPWGIFRLGYARGLQSKWRRKRQHDDDETLARGRQWDGSTHRPTAPSHEGK